MGILNNSDNSPGLLPTPGFQQQLPPRIVDAAYRDNIIDTSIVPHQAIITHIEGSPWTVYYFQQVAGQDTLLRPPQVGSSEVTTGQQYNFIENMEVRLQGSFSYAFDSEKNENNVTGTAVSYPFFTPNEHDVFFADIGDGRTGVFIVGKPQPKSYFKETVWEWDFSLLGESKQQDYRNYLNEHTVKKFYYSLDYLQLGRNPLMTTTEYTMKQDLLRLRNEVLSRFLEEFFSHEYRALLLNHQGKLVYDPLLQKALTSLCDRSEHPYIARMIDRPTDECFELRVPTLWDMLIRGQPELHYTITKKMWVLPKAAFSQYVHNHGLRYSRLDFIVYPDRTTPFDNNPLLGLSYYRPDKIDLLLHYNRFVLNGLPQPQSTHPTGEVEEEPYQEPVLVRPVNDDEYYVFTKAFYENIPGSKTKMELITEKMLKQERFDYNIIKELCRATKDWQPLDRYYYSLVLVALCNYAIKHL